MGLLGLAAKTVKELVQEGYPESVAKKIADGTLKMDDASREARAGLMNMTDDTFLRGHSVNARPASNEDMFMVKVEQDGDFPGSKAYGVAESYARGGEVYDEALDDYVTVPGEVTPLRHNANRLFEVDVGGDDYSGAYASPPGWEGIKRIGSDEIASGVKGYSHNTGLQGTRFEDMVDYYDNASSPGHPTDIYNVLGSRPDVQIRHAEKAAFDPEYNGPNIMGGAALPVAAGLMTAGQSEEADAGVALRMAQGVDLDRLVGAWRKAVSREPDIHPSTHLQNIIHNKDSADPYSLLPVAGIGAAAASLTAPFMKDSGMASAPRSETLGDITMGLRDVERRLEGSPASLLFPEGLTNYLETVNRSTEDPNWLTRAMAALDFAP